MGSQTIVHGRIALKGNSKDFNAARAFISSLKFDDSYPAIRSEMFSYGAKKNYYFEPAIAFASTYKGMEDYLTPFIIKFEHVLRNISFTTAKIQVETESMGTYNFFWKTKAGNENFTEKEGLTETEEWYFGEGFRSMHGLLLTDLKDEDTARGLGFEYPIRFDQNILNDFNQALEKSKHLLTGEKIYIPRILNFKKSNDVKQADDYLYDIIVYYATITGTKYGYGGESGYWVEKTDVNTILNL
jgi:hypothetical protein